MTTQSMACGSCAAAVPFGRLSCPSCGELLASVAGGRRVASGARTSTATPSVLYEIDAAPTASVVDGDLSVGSVADATDAGLPWGIDDDPAGVELETDGHAASDVMDGADDGTALADEDDDDPLAPVARPIPAVLSSVPEAATAASWAVAGLAAATTLAPDAPTVAPDPPVARVAAPGAYVPPPPLPLQIAGPAAPARAWAGHADPSGAGAGSASEARAESDVEAAAVTRVDEFVRWLAVAGSALSAAGFLLPWSSVVIGAPGTGYFDRWGMAGPWHVVVVLAVLAVLVLAVVANPIPVWIRVGLPGLGLGALLAGLVWPYLIGPLGAGPGVLMVVVGALSLVTAGVAALAVDRRTGTDQPA